MNTIATFVILTITTGKAFAAEREPVYEDLNFDGFRDKKVFLSRGGGRNAVNEDYEVYLYNPKTRHYELNERLTDLGNPQPDAKTKTIRVFSRATPIDVTNVFKWSGTDLVLIESATLDYSHPRGILETVKRRKNGKMRIISQKVFEAH